MFDAVSSHGKWWLTKKFGGQEKRRILIEPRIKALVDRYGEGKVPESEILLAIADVLGATSAPRWAAMVRERKRWFVTGEHRRAGELRGLEPRPDVPYSAAAGTPTAPSARVQPQQTADLGARIAQIAEQELRLWHPPSGKILEAHSAAIPMLERYYREGVGQDVAADVQSPGWRTKVAWSAAFVSWVMRTADRQFRVARAHWRYVRDARKNRLNGVTDNPFWAYRIGEAARRSATSSSKAAREAGSPMTPLRQGRVHPRRHRHRGSSGLPPCRRRQRPRQRRL